MLYVPAVELEPFSRSGTNTQWQDQVDTQLPGLLAGILLLAACLAVPALIAARRKRRG